MSYRNYVKIITYTWSKDSHGLFDYESSHLFTAKFKITGQAHFFRSNNQIQMNEENNLVDQIENDKNPLLFSIHEDKDQKDHYYLSLGNNLNPNQSLGLVVRGIKKDTQPSGYELKVGDNVKIGRVRFNVREIRDAEGNVTKLQTAQQINYLKRSNIEEETENPNQNVCRICLVEDGYTDPVENTLIGPCKCKGSCEYVHLKCLKQWIDSKKSRVENSNNHCLFFNYKKLSCEICKENLPYSIKLDDEEHEIVEIKKPATPYLLLEKIETAKENRGLFLIKASNEEARIGRGHTNSILVSDISVSRSHAFISYKNGKFLLFDNNSKFGTLVEINQPIEVQPNKTIIQCGKTVIIFSLKREDLITMPKVLDVVDVLNSPGTPSTINETEEQKQVSNDIEGPMRKRARPTKIRREESILITDPANVPYIEILDDINGGEIEAVENKILTQSKKIFKIIRPDPTQLVRADTAAENPRENKRARGRKRN